MKKVILSAAVVVLGLAATSCKKSYVCRCDDYNYSPSKTTFSTVKSSNQTDANTTCYKMGDQVNTFCGLTY